MFNNIESLIITLGSVNKMKIKLIIVLTVFLLIISSINVVSINVNNTNSENFSGLTDEEIETLQKRSIEENWGFTVAKNSATERSMDQLCGFYNPYNIEETYDVESQNINSNLPSHFDWNDANYNYKNRKCTTPIRNQGDCGSCWAFGTVGPLESAILIKEGVSVDLSEQWLVSCNTAGYGCGGGWWAHKWHSGTAGQSGGTGAVLESDFGYKARDLPCSGSFPHVYLVDDWNYVGSKNSVPSTQSIKQAIYEYGPVSVAIHVNNAFRSYDEGIFDNSANGDINHAVVLVGWQNDPEVLNGGYWILRNSWDADWGEDGYMRIAYECNRVGYAACYITGYEKILGGDQTVSIIFDYATNDGDQYEDIDVWPLQAPEWYYKLYLGDVYSETVENLKNSDWGGFWPFNWESEHTWDIDQEHIIYTEVYDVYVQIELWDYDPADSDDQADINPIPNLHMFAGTYDMYTDTLKNTENAILNPDSQGFYETIGYNNDNAKMRFKLLDSYDAGDYKPELDVSGSLSFGGVRKGETATQSITIKNIAAVDPFDKNPDLSFEIENIPNWASASVSSGTIQAGEDQDVSFEIDTEDLGRDFFSETIKVTSNGGSENIPISVTVSKEKTQKNSIQNIFLILLKQYFPRILSFI